MEGLLEDVEALKQEWKLNEAIDLLGKSIDGKEEGDEFAMVALSKSKLELEAGLLSSAYKTGMTALSGGARDSVLLRRCADHVVDTCLLHSKYLEAEEIVKKYELGNTLSGLAVLMEQERYSECLEVVGHLKREEEEPYRQHSMLLELYKRVGDFDRVAEEMRYFEAQIIDSKVQKDKFLFLKVAAQHVSACFFLREFLAIKSVNPLPRLWGEQEDAQKADGEEEEEHIPSPAKDSVSRIVVAAWAHMIELSHEHMPILRNFNFGIMPVVYHGIRLFKRECGDDNVDPVFQVRTLLSLARCATELFCYDWVFDQQNKRTDLKAYNAYCRGYLDLRDALYEVRETMRINWEVSDSRDDLQGTGWIFLKVAERLAQSHTEKFLVELMRCHYRSTWSLILDRLGEATEPLLQLKKRYSRAFQFYVSENWKAFQFHLDESFALFASLGVTRANCQTRYAYEYALHRDLCRLLASFHMHHSGDHTKAVAAMERHKCLFVEGYDPEKPFHHIPPRLTVIYFIKVLHLTEVWTNVKLHEEEHHNQVVPELYCYNYYRKNFEGPGEGTLTLLPKVLDHATFIAQAWEGAQEKERMCLSSIHLSLKKQLDSVAGIYKTYATRVLIIPTGSLGCIPWAAMPSSNQQYFIDLMGECILPGLGFYELHEEEKGKDKEKGVSSLLVSCRKHECVFEPKLPQSRNEVRIPQKHFGTDPSLLCVDSRAQEGNGKSDKNAVLNKLFSRGSWGVVHLSAPANARRILFSGGGEWTLSEIRSYPHFPRIELLVLCDCKPYAEQTLEGPLGLAKAFMERGVSMVLMSLLPLSSKKKLELFAYFYTLLERFPRVAPDALLNRAMVQLRKTTSKFVEWGSFEAVGCIKGREEQLVLPEDWKWPNIFSK